MTEGLTGGMIAARAGGGPAPARKAGTGPASKGRRDQHVFVGTHERQLDDKGRLALPATFRPDLQGSCYLAFGQDRCVTIFAAAEFEALAADMMSQVREGQMSQHRLRAVAGSAALVAIDKQGRITVDEHLRQYAQLQPSSRVVVRGRFDRGEIWCEDFFHQVAAVGEDEMAGITAVPTAAGGLG